MNNISVSIHRRSLPSNSASKVSEDVPPEVPLPSSPPAYNVQTIDARPYDPCTLRWPDCMIEQGTSQTYGAGPHDEGPHLGCLMFTRQVGVLPIVPCAEVQHAGQGPCMSKLGLLELSSWNPHLHAGQLELCVHISHVTCRNG